MGFLEVPWIADRQAYDVAVPYLDVCMSIFDNEAHTVRVVSPFIYRDTYLRVHPNGAAIFAEDKRLAYLLPLIVEAHGLLPPAPLFWVHDDKTILLTGKHHGCILAQSSGFQILGGLPPELRDEIQPRLDKLKPPARPMQPPQPLRPTRWRELHKEKSNAQASQVPVPQQLAETDRRYMELQAVMATLGQRTPAESRLKAKPTKPRTRRNYSFTRAPAGGHRPCYTEQRPTSAHQAQCTDINCSKTNTASATVPQRTKEGCPGYRRAI